jgi:hypothetical protein
MKVLMVIGLAMAAIASCSAVPLETRTAGVGGPVFCFSAVVRAKEGRSMSGCADTAALCRRALFNARRWGSMAGVLELGRCEPMELGR